jgi:hypothetical protein
MFSNVTVKILSVVTEPHRPLYQSPRRGYRMLNSVGAIFRIGEILFYGASLSLLPHSDQIFASLNKKAHNDDWLALTSTYCL